MESQPEWFSSSRPILLSLDLVHQLEPMPVEHLYGMAGFFLSGFPQSHRWPSCHSPRFALLLMPPLSA